MREDLAQTSPRLHLWMAMVTLSGLMACGSAPKPESPPPVTTLRPPIPKLDEEARPALPKVSVDTLTPYFEAPALRQALDDFRAGRNIAAMKAFQSGAQDLEDPDAKRAAEFMALLAAHDAGECAASVAPLEDMASSWPLMAAYAWFYAGSCHLTLGQPERARRAFAEVPSDSPLSPRAGDKLAESWRVLKRPDRAIAALESSLARHPNARAATWFRLIEDKKSLGDSAGVKAARRELATRMPRSVEGRAARKALGADHGLSSEQLLAIALSWYRAQSHKKAVTAFEEVLAASQPGSPHHCEARVKLGRTYEKMKKRSVAWRHFAKALACKGEPLADATFAGGRNRLRAKEYDSAIRLLTRHINAFPKRSTVDDARVMIAKSQRALGDDQAADATLLETLKRHPDGDLIDEAAWSLQWPLIEARKWRASVAMADTILTHVPRERSYRAEGRTLYWRARALQRLKDDQAAKEGYRAVLERYPMSWYALLAYHRLDAYGDVEAKRVLAELADEASAPESPLSFIPDALWSNAHFRRGVELARMGLTKSARRELQRVAMDTDDDEAIAPRVVTWTKVALYEMAEAHDLATHLARAEEPRFGAYWPKGEHRRLWELAHQRGYADLVESWAKDRDIDPAWVYAIIREESGFNPTIESWANAIGLMQIIMPTAKGLAKGTRITPTPARLRQPAIAIELGTKYLKALLERHPVLPLASAGYNAGGGAVAKWRKKRGHLPLDEFVETIPYKEARGYAKRVTRSVARYRLLHGDGEVLPLALAPPGKP